MRDWMPKSEALKKAQVSAFDAKRYLSSLSKIVTDSRPIIRGGMVSSCVPELLMKFKTLEENGLSMEQIEQVITENLVQGRQPGSSPVTIAKCHSVQIEADSRLILSDVIKKVSDVIKQVAEYQVELHLEVVKISQYFEEEMNALRISIAKLEKKRAKS